MTGPLDEGLSGGDLHGLRLQEKWQSAPDATATLLTVPSMERRLDPSLPRVVVRTRFDERIGSLYTYMLALLVRSRRAAVAAPPADVVVATSHFFNDVRPMAAHRRRHGSLAACFVYHLVSESGRERSLRSAVSSCLERVALRTLRRNADLVFVDNDATEAALVARGFSPEKLVRTGNAYDDPSVEMPPRSESPVPIVLYCGRLASSKGVEDLPELARALAAAGSDARVVVAGDGPLRPALEARAARIPNLTLLGFVSEEEKWRLLRQAAVFVSPSREEGWGIAVGEALLAGTPAFVLDLPAYAHFGDLVTRADAPSELKQSVLEVVLDSARLAERRQTLERRRDELPTWNAVLERELKTLAEACRRP